MKLHELYKRIDPKTDMLNSALAALHRRASSKGDLQSIDGYAFDIIRSYNIDIGAKELARLYREKHNIAEDEESVNEGYKLQLERDADMMVLHIVDTAGNKRTEVRGKAGYETGGYDANDKLHQLLDKIGKTANVSELMNGETVTINPNHPQGASAKKATDVAFNENVSALASELEAKYNLKSLFLGDMASRNAIELHSIIVNREDQGKGTGSKVMQELIKYADDNGKIMVLDPGLLDKKHGTTSQSRLRKFYKQFGFIDNKGRNKNYEFRNLMIRYPQSNESVNEAFDNPYKFKVTENNNNRWQAQAVTDNNIIISFLATNIDTGWGIDFKTANADTPNNTTYDLTGKGDGQRTMTTVLAMLKKFIQDHSPKEIYFDAAKDAGNSRTNLYQKIVQRFAGGLGYTVDVQDAGNRDDFTLVKKVQEATVTEALDQPYPVRWVIRDDDEWEGKAKTEAGDSIQIMITQGHNNHKWEIDFYVGGSMQVTGKGDQFRVFATIVSAVKKWWSWLSKSKQPVEAISFSAFKGNKSAAGSTGRSSLYNRFATQFARSIGFTVSTVDSKDNIKFVLTNPNYKSQQTENFANGKNPGRKEIAVHRSSEKFSNIDLSKSADGTFWLAAPDADWNNIVTTGKGVEHAYEISPTAKLASWDDIDKYSVDELEGMGYDGVRMVDGKDISYQIWNTDILTKTELSENFADGKKPGRKGLAKRSGVNTKASVSDLRKTAKNSSGEKQRMAHWLANMKSGKAKKK